MSTATATFYGINFHFGLGPTTVTVTNATGVYQSARYSTPMDKLETRDQRGQFIAVQYTNPIEKLTLEYLASDANTASGSAAITFPLAGTNVTITSDGPFTGANWKVDAPDLNETNTANSSITLNMTRYVGF